MLNRILYTLALFLCSFFSLQAQNLSGITICVNPGHGGYDSDDRNMVIFPFTGGDKNGFWESKSNLDKGFHLRNLLQGAGANVIMTRTTNEHSEAGGNCDTPLSAIVEMANANNSDYMLSIHSNAGGNNMILMLYSGIDAGDTYNYSHPAPFRPESKIVSEKIAQQLYSNQTTQWTSAPSIRGDKTFARLVMGWSTGYGVLRNLIVPGVISEGGMHDYIPETYRLMNADYKKLEAWHFFKAFCLQYNGGSQNIGKIVGWVKDKDRSFLSAFPGSPGYFAIQGTSDNYKPLNGAKVTLFQNNTEIKNYTVDQLYNGIYAFDSLAPGNYKLRFEKEAYTTAEMDVEVKAFEVTYANRTLNLDRSNPLVVEAFYPNITTSDSVATSVKIRMNFNFELNRSIFESAFSITPIASGTFEYSNFDKSVAFIPNEPLQSKTVYTIKIDKSACHIDNVPMVADHIFSFKTQTKRFLNLVDWYPRANDIVYPNTQVKLFFDRPINNSGINTKVIVKDESNQEVIGEGFLYNDFSGGLGDYQFRLPALSPEKTYTLIISKEVFDNDTLKLPESLSIPFQTSKVIEVDVNAIKDRFETINLWKIETAISKHLTGTNNMVRYSTIKYAGSYAYRLLYKFSQPDEAKIIASYRTPTIEVNRSNYVGVYAFGDLTHNQLDLMLTSENDTIYQPLTELNFAGWKFVECSLNNLTEGKTYKLSGFRVACTGNMPQSLEGAVILDNLSVYNQAISSVSIINSADNVYLYPNPTRGTLFVKNLKPNTLLYYKVIDIQGQTILSNWRNTANNDIELNMTTLKTGIYILQTIVDNKTNHYRFIVN